MVEENSSQTSQEMPQQPPAPVSGTANQPENPVRPYSVKKKIGIALLVLLGLVIGVPFLLFMACLGIVAISH